MSSRSASSASSDAGSSSHAAPQAGERHIAIIGSGFGGLSAAVRLRAQGFRVTVFEKNERVGGHAYQLQKQGYTFDMGPSLITAPDIIESVFKAAGRSMEDYMDLAYLDPFYRIYFHDKTFVDYNGKPDHMKAQIAQFSQHDADNYDSFMEAAGKLYKAVITDGLGSTPFMELKTFAGFVPKALKLNALYPAYAFTKKYFRDFRTRFMFSFHPLFIGASPFSAPAIYLMIPYLERHGGVWFSKGGMYSFIQALERVFLELGGEIRTSSPIEEIVVRGGKAVGVRVAASDGERDENRDENRASEFIAADAVVSNADFAHTYTKLIDSKARKKWTDARVMKMDYSMGAFLMYIGTKKKYPELLHHTLILSERYRELVADIFDKKVLPEDFSMYLHVPTRTDPAMAPEGCESMYVLIPVANLASGVQWSDVKQRYADEVLRFLEEDFGMEALRENIEVCELFTPEDFRNNRNSHLGSAWGLQPKLTQTAYLRPHNRSEDIPNLYFVGTSTHPGAGVPGVLLTSETTEKIIMQDFHEHGLSLARTAAGAEGFHNGHSNGHSHSNGHGKQAHSEQSHEKV
jgi:phytoene desaturase